MGYPPVLPPATMPKNRRDPVVGTVIADRFHVKRPLAEGGMGKVYVARDGEDGPRIALKLFLGDPTTADYEQLLGRARREAETMAQLEHTNIVRTFDHGTWGDGYYLAMELLEGRSLTNYVRDTEADPYTCLRLLLQLCAAVRHAHRKGIVHRDLKAANVIVIPGDTEPLVKLIDFGVVKVDGLTSLSGAGTLLGSVHTMPPEHVRGEEVDHRADIYSLGVLAFRLLQGRYPYHSRVAAEVITKHVHAPIPELDPRPEIPPGVPPIIRKCLAKDPNDRYDDVGQLVLELSEALDTPTALFVGGSAITDPKTGQRTDTPEPRQRQVTESATSAPVIAFAVVVVLVLLGGAYYLAG